ncbi:MAG: hypothetical protein WA941_08580 [Nitrososphaeraceae archaeon]
MDKSPIIESTVPPIKVSRISIVNLVCILKLRSSNNQQEKEIVMKLPTSQDPIQMNISLGSNLTFYKEIKPLELESLLKWRRGGDVTLSWTFRGNGLADINRKAILLELSYDPDSSFVSPQISQNKWDLMLNRFGLEDKFLSEHSISIPENLGHKHSQFLNQILSDLTTMTVNLNNAKDRIRKASNASDYKAVMGDVKSALDSIKNFSITPVNAKEFLVDSMTFMDRDSGGGEKAALEVMGRIKDIMENIYEISSKPAHTGLKKGGLKFDMSPGREDALFVFESSLCLLEYFMEKFKKLN